MSKFTGNLGDLDLEYQASKEKDNGDGTQTVRYVLTDNKQLTPQKLEEISNYENIKVSKNGATLRHAPELTYDVVFITNPSEGDEFAVESFDDEHLGYSSFDKERFVEGDDSEEILNQLDDEVTQTQTTGNSQYKYSLISSAITIENDSILFYDSLIKEFPEYSDLIEGIRAEDLKHVGQLQALLMDTPEIAKDINKGREEGEQQLLGNPESDLGTAEESFEGEGEDLRMLELQKIVIKKLRESQLLGDEVKEEIIGDIEIEGLEEFMGFCSIEENQWVENTEKKEKALSSPEEMELAAEDYIKKLEEINIELR